MRQAFGCLVNLLVIAFLAVVGVVVYFKFFAAQQISAPGPGSAVPPLDAREPSEPAQRRRPPATQPTEEGRLLVAALLKQLDAFKANRRFHETGFGESGNFQPWLARAQAAQGNERFSPAERAALGDLITLAQEYRQTGGAENEMTRTLREYVERAMQRDEDADE